MHKEKLQIDVMPLDWGVDRQEVMRLEIQHEFPWTEKEFLSYCNCKQSWKNLVVRGADQRLVAYIITKGDRTQRYIQNLMVEPESRRKGIGARLIRTAIEKARRNRIKSLVVELRETNLAAQLFFRSLGFQCTNVEHNYFDCLDEDCYVLKRSIM